MSAKHTVRNERGMALAIAIFALVIVGALVAGALFAGTQEERVGESSRRLQQSFGVAEMGAFDVVRTWTAATYNSRGNYATDSIVLPNALATGATPKRTGSYGGYVYRLNSELYLIDVTAHDTLSGMASFGGGRARQRLGMLTRIKVLSLPTPASLTTANSDAIAGTASIDGNDHVPAGWTGCGPLDSTRAGIRTDAGTTVSSSGSSSITGNPPIMVDASVNDSTFNQFGDVSYSQLAANAGGTLAPGTYSSIAPSVSGGVCNKAVTTNWGDGLNPTQPCGNYFPIIHIAGAGTTTINNTQGQGILLIDGSLDVNGGFQFFGIVIVRGSLTTAGGGGSPAHFWGTVMVHDSAYIGSNSIAGSANLAYSQCAILRVLDNNGVVVPMRSRGWV